MDLGQVFIWAQQKGYAVGDDGWYDYSKHADHVSKMSKDMSIGQEFFWFGVIPSICLLLVYCGIKARSCGLSLMSLAAYVSIVVYACAKYGDEGFASILAMDFICSVLTVVFIIAPGLLFSPVIRDLTSGGGGGNPLDLTK